jgi:hypothetical protein
MATSSPASRRATVSSGPAIASPPTSSPDAVSSVRSSRCLLPTSSRSAADMAFVSAGSAYISTAYFMVSPTVDDGGKAMFAHPSS